MDQQPYDRDCSPKCRSPAHALQIFKCIPSGTTSQIKSYSVYVCHNFPLVTDNVGRNMLHVAAACGKWEIVQWLVANCNVDIDIKDQESGWTALHRSFYYGQLSAARLLFNLGASLKATDHECFTPIDIILQDRLPYIEYIPSYPSEVYAWGSNFNYNLGLGNAQSRSTPEILEVFRKDSINIKQAVVCKFHSAFLSTAGKVYTCGYGHGGRLGQGNEDITLLPSLVKGIGNQICVQIAAGQDHLLVLIEGGQVWSCGLNTYHQLGHVPPSERSLMLKPLSLKFLKGKEIIGVRAARFHSVIFSKDCIFTFGLNAGQLGHSKGDRTQISPRQVSVLYNETWNITHVETSDGATVCATNRGDIYVLHEYQTRKIASRQLEISKLSVVGGHLDSKCDVAGVREGGGLELKVVLLTKSGKVYLWRQTDPYLRRCLFATQKELIISDLHINNYTVGLITSGNEGYIGTLVSHKGPRSAPTVNVHTTKIFNSKTAHCLNFLLDTDECNFIKVKKLQHIYRGTSITSDSKGRNFVILQTNPKMGLVDLPVLSESEILNDYSKLFSETSLEDDFHDIIIKVKNREFPAHRYILSSRSDFFKKQILADVTLNKLTLENLKPEAVEQVLKFIYSNRCDFLTQGYEVNWETEQVGKKKKTGTKTSKSTNPIVILQEVSRKLGMSLLAKKLENVKLINGQINLLDSSPVEKICFDRRSLTQLCDVNLLSSDGSVFCCHKCVLIARLDYFHSMLSTFWAENFQLGNLNLPISSQVLEVILDYIYMDKANKVLDSEDSEFVCHVLLISDQLLMPRLKELCEMALIELINLKNAAELLELASVYNSLQLKQSCMQFICINLAAIIETKALDVLSDDVIEDLSKYYRNLVPSMNNRRMFFSTGPSNETLDFVESSFPVDDNSTFVRSRLDLYDAKPKSKRRTNSARYDLKDISGTVKNRTCSESSDKDIVLDVIISNINDFKVTEENSCHQRINTSPSHVTPTNSPVSRPVPSVMHCPNTAHFPSLEQVMLETQHKFQTLNKNASKKPIPHLSQKQKKLLTGNNANSNEIPIPKSPPSATSCPWAKLPHQSPPSPSFWEAVSNKDFPPSCELLKTNSGSEKAADNQQESENAVLSLNEIQKAEEQKLHRAVNPVIKPLHILNIEDQAIEELLVMYNAKDNPKERITISRVVPTEIASPIWKKHLY